MPISGDNNLGIKTREGEVETNWENLIISATHTWALLQVGMETRGVC